MAATTMVGATGDALSMDEKKFEYLSSINSMARKIMQEREKIKEKHGSAWNNMTPVEQDTAIDNVMMDPHIRARYGMHRVNRDEVVCYPKLLLQTGQKIVHFGEEDLTWQDEHSAPFSWETKSQLDFSLSTGASEPSAPSAVVETKPSKPAQGNQLAKPTPPPKSSNNNDAARRGEEESSFWKISLERSRLEGEKAEFQSLTPSQIKSMEKGEKPLPSYLRTEAEEPPPPSRPTKQRAPRPPAPPPPIPVIVPPAPVSVTPAAISVTPAAVSAPAPPPPSVAGWERSQSTLPSVTTTLDDVFSPGLASKAPASSSSAAKEEDKSEVSLGSSPTLSQLTGGSLLKTGFDFLDNW
ncbi:uncharacterized protein C1orf198 homolog [Engraulis encrasicolus]|uniref:uncharacterized protein C1orf198 homolog n=1 Tax=Engraulis encrasicolus TaxID=184585 RepID=UPI002FD51BA7